MRLKREIGRRRPRQLHGQHGASKCGSELIGRNVCLAQDAGKRADFDLVMHRHYATFRSTSHDDVTAGLANLYEPEMLKSFDDGRPRGARQLRHKPEG